MLLFLLVTNDRRKSLSLNSWAVAWMRWTLSALLGEAGCCISMCDAGVWGRYHPQHWLLTQVFSLLLYQQNPSFTFHGSLIFRARDEHVVAIDTAVSTMWSFQYAAIYQKIHCKELTAKNTWKSISRLLPAAIHCASRGKPAVLLLWWLCEDKSLEILKWGCLDVLRLSNLWVSDAKEKSAWQLWDLDFIFYYMYYLFIYNLYLFIYYLFYYIYCIYRNIVYFREV